MAQQRRRSPAKKSGSSGASRRSAGTRKKSGGAPGWVWLVTGLLAGLFIAFLVTLHKFDGTPARQADKQVKSQSAPTHKESKSSEKKGNEHSTTNPPPKKTAAPTTTAKPATSNSDSGKKDAATSAKSSVNYDFYKILPQSEVVIPEDDAHKTESTTQSSAPGTYYLQVGAFRSLQEADGRKAELAMLGIVTTIQTVTLSPNNSWHRVRIGPVKDMRQLDRTKQQLQSNNIAFVTIKEKN